MFSKDEFQDFGPKQKELRTLQFNYRLLCIFFKYVRFLTFNSTSNVDCDYLHVSHVNFKSQVMIYDSHINSGFRGTVLKITGEY